MLNKSKTLFNTESETDQYTGWISIQSVLIRISVWVWKCRTLQEHQKGFGK